MAGQGARAARPTTIRRCTGCNQGCYGNLTQGLPITCVTNPAVGREADARARHADAGGRARKRVVVVGGGPAGLEAAWVAAARGHDVTLLERGDAARRQDPPGRSACPGAASSPTSPTGAPPSASAAASTSGSAHDATVESVLALAPDAVIVATGGRATKIGAVEVPPDAGRRAREQPFVLDHEAALRAAPTSSAPRVVILDVVGHIEAIGLGELLARARQRGHRR